MIVSFAKVQTQDRLTNQLQDNISKSISGLNAVPLNDGLVLSDVDLVGGSNIIYTTLPSRLQGWFIVGQDAAADIYDEQSTNTNPQTLVLNSTGTVTVSLFVF